MPRAAKGRGFTLIELMIVVAIIGILASIAIPKFADLLRKAQEGATKGKLGSIRSALSIYYADNEGYFPIDVKTNPSTVLEDTLIPKYIDVLPESQAPPYHASSNLVRTHETPYDHTHDDGYWGYGSLAADSDFGALWVMCSHTDSKGNQWSTY